MIGVACRSPEGGLEQARNPFACTEHGLENLGLSVCFFSLLAVLLSQGLGNSLVARGEFREVERRLSGCVVGSGLLGRKKEAHRRLGNS